MSTMATALSAQVALDAGAGGEITSRVAMGNHWLVLQRTEGGGLLRVVGPDGAAPLEVAITPEGPVLHLRAGLAIAADGPLSLTADAIELSGRRGVSITSDGGIEMRARGDLLVDAAAQSFTALAGDVALRANDDVRLNGERIKLNC